MNNGEVLVKKGTSTKILNDGVAGYYTDPVKSALPWDEEGQLLAGRPPGRARREVPQHRQDQEGDAIVFETRDTWYVYKVYATLPETSKYNVDVLQPVPKESGKKKAGPLHHPDDLHAGLHLAVPLRRLGRAGAHGEGRRGPHAARGAALTADSPSGTTGKPRRPLRAPGASPMRWCRASRRASRGRRRSLPSSSPPPPLPLTVTRFTRLPLGHLGAGAGVAGDHGRVVVLRTLDVAHVEPEVLEGLLGVLELLAAQVGHRDLLLLLRGLGDVQVDADPGAAVPPPAGSWLMTVPAWASALVLVPSTRP